MLKHHHRIGVVIGRFHQTFHIRRIARISDFDSLDGQQRTLHRTTVVGSTPAISARWNTNHAGNWEFPHTQICTLAQFRHQLVYARPDIIGKLNLHNGLGTHRTHTRRTSNDVCLLNGRIEHPILPIFIGQSSRFPEHTTQSMPHVLTVQQRLRVLSQNLIHRMQCRIHHHHHLCTFRRSISCLINHSRWGQNMIHQGFRLWIFRCFCLLEIIKNPLLSGQTNRFKSLLRFTQCQQQLLHPRQWIQTHLLLQIVSIPLTANTTGVMAQQRHLHMHQHRSTLMPHIFNGLGHFIVTLYKITAVDSHPAHALETQSIIKRIHRTHLIATGRNTPIVVLNQIQNGQLMQNSHLKRLGNLTFGHRTIAQRTQYNGLFGAGNQILAFQIFDSVGRTSSWYGLHPSSRTLVWHFYHIRAVQ